MIAQAQTELPNECCGLLAGTIGADGIARVSHRYPLVSDLDADNPEPHPLRSSPTEYLSNPASMFAAWKDMRAHNVDIVAVYHSHPISDPVPSKKDLERNYLGDVVHFIVGLKDSTPLVRGWWLTDTDSREAEWEVVQ
jgi:proteasome lid subunit RPN8/RPN11